MPVLTEKGLIGDLVDGICRLVKLPFEIIIEVEKNVGTKAIISMILVGTWAYAQITGIGVSPPFTELASAAAGAYLGYSIHKAGGKQK